MYKKINEDRPDYFSVIYKNVKNKQSWELRNTVQEISNSTTFYSHGIAKSFTEKL